MEQYLKLFTFLTESDIEIIMRKHKVGLIHTTLQLFLIETVSCLYDTQLPNVIISSRFNIAEKPGFAPSAEKSSRIGNTVSPWRLVRSCRVNCTN